MSGNTGLPEINLGCSFKKGEVMKKSLLLCLVFVGVLICQSAAAGSKSKNYGEMTVSKILSVKDGDTFYCNIKDYPPIVGENIPVMLKGINAPELKDEREEIKQQAYAAKKFVTQTFRRAKVIKLKNMERGKYFWIDADVEVDGQDLGKLLIDKGLAKPYGGGKKRKRSNRQK